MSKIKDVEWFKRDFASNLGDYELKYKFFEDGDFGTLNQVEFNSTKKGGNIDFWGLGWLGIFVWDYETEEQVFNILLEPHQEAEKEKAFNELIELLK